MLGGIVANEVFDMYLVRTPDGIILVGGYCITCLNLSELVVLEPSFIFRSEGGWSCALMPGLCRRRKM